MQRGCGSHIGGSFPQQTIDSSKGKLACGRSTPLAGSIFLSFRLLRRYPDLQSVALANV